MQRFRVLVVALLGVCVLGAFASATAFALPVILNKAKEVAGAVKFKAEGKETTFAILEGKATVKCETVTAEGEFRAGTPLGTTHIDFGPKCTTGLGGVCTGLGEAEGKILVLAEIHIVEDREKGALTGAVLFLLEPVHFACVIAGITVLILVKGQVLCLINPINTLTAKYNIVCLSGAKAGDPGETVFLNDSEKVVNIAEGLLGSEDDKTFKMASQSGEIKVTPALEIEIMA